MAGMLPETETSESEDLLAKSETKPVGFVYRYYVLVIVTMISAVSILDRNILGALLQSIKEDMHLSDTLAGTFSLAFAVTYAVFGIPLGYVADKWSRTRMISIAVGLWSFFTILCGLVQNGLQMFLARLGVGFGEAGASAPGQAIVADIFPAKERSTAMAILTVASPAGMGLGIFFGGWAAAEFGWRWAFVLAGLPGLLLVPLVLFTFPETANRKKAVVTEKATENQISFWVTLKTLASIRTLPLLFGGAMLTSVINMGFLMWVPSFFERSFDLGSDEAGRYLGIALFLGPIIGHLAGGFIADYIGRFDVRWHLWLGALTTSTSGLITIAAILANNPLLAAALFGLQAAIAGFFAGPLIAITMSLAPSWARATCGGIMLFVIYIFALGVAPQVIGIISDTFREAYGEESLRYSLLAVTTVAIPSTLFYFIGSFFYKKDLARTPELEARFKS